MAVHCVFRLGVAILACFLLFSHVTAHLDLTRDELVEYYRDIKRDGEALSRCLKSPAMREHTARMLAHQNETLHNLRKARGIDLDFGSCPFLLIGGLIAEPSQISRSATIRTEQSMSTPTTRQRRGSLATHKISSTSAGMRHRINTRAVRSPLAPSMAPSGSIASHCARTFVLVS